ncbi:MAG: hypothetical protein EB127_13975 [Alphaproteobacteria bacterium]|nr:hypothetical protein [Alphaproteobacteria bacterium]
MSSNVKQLRGEIQSEFLKLKENTIKLFNTLCEPKGDLQFDKFRADIKAINLVHPRKGGRMTRRKKRKQLK